MGVRRVVRGLFGVRRTDFYGVATEVRRVPPAELAVAEAALAGAGPMGHLLVSQLREAPDVWRLIGDDGTCELRVSTRIELGVHVPRAGWTSRWIPVRAVPSARDLEMALVVSTAGILELHGRAPDGERWPREWRADPASLQAIRQSAPWLRLPAPAEVREDRARAISTIEAWLGAPGLLASKRGLVSIEPPATDDAIAEFERLQRFVLPAAYRELLGLADGFEIGSIVVLGTRDAYRLDIPGPDRLILAPPDEDGAFVLAPSGEVRFVDREASSSDGRVRAPGLREWVRRRLRVNR